MSSNLRSVPNYPAWFTADTGHAFATGLFMTGLVLLVTDLGGTETQAGLVSGAGGLGSALTLLPGGVLADRYDRRSLVTWGSACALVSTIALGVLVVAGSRDFIWYAVLVFIAGACISLYRAAIEATLPVIVPPKALADAYSANQARDAIVTVFASFVAGPLVELAASSLVAARAFALGVVLTAFRRIRLPRPEAVEASPGKASSGFLRKAWADLRGGIVAVMTHHVFGLLMVIITLVGFAFSAGMVVVTVWVLAETGSSFLGGSVAGLFGVAMVLGSMIATPLLRRFGTGWIMAIALLLVAAGFASIAWLDQWPAVLAILAASLLGGPALNAGAAGCLAAGIPDHQRGRAMSLLAFSGTLAAALGTAAGGYAFKHHGWFWSTNVVAGIMVLCIVLTLGSRHVRTIGTSEQWADGAEE